MAALSIGGAAGLASSGARLVASGGTDVTAWASAAATLLQSVLGGGGSSGGPASGTGYRVSGTITNAGFSGSWFGRSANSKQGFEFPLVPADGQTRLVNEKFGSVFTQLPPGTSIPVQLSSGMQIEELHDKIGQLAQQQATAQSVLGKFLGGFETMQATTIPNAKQAGAPAVPAGMPALPFNLDPKLVMTAALLLGLAYAVHTSGDKG